MIGPNMLTSNSPANFERQYQQLLTDILDYGDPRMDRTGVGTKALFGTSLRLDLGGGHVPILTTKRVYWKTAVKEMLWFLTGGTNIRELLLENVKIWTDWPLDRYRKATGENITQDEFERRILDDLHFAQEWGDLGPVYGKQWRRWKGPNGREYDQIADLVTTLRETPASRRMLFHGWNVADVADMALPPCHLLYQYHVTSEGRLNAILYQRSVDTLLGLPFNLTSHSALTLMLAQQADLTPGELIWFGADTHLYSNHFEQAREIISRAPHPLPTMHLTRKAASIDDYSIDDFAVDGYDPWPAIQADVAV